MASYWFDIIRFDGTKKRIVSSSLSDIVRMKNNYRRSPHFKSAYISRISSNMSIKPLQLGSMARWKSWQ